eukprot:4215842-Lingulodinium_polyedra.AAC.1
MAEVEFTRPSWRGEVPLVPDSNSNPIGMNFNTIGNIDSTAYPTEARERQKIAEKGCQTCRR